MLHELFVRPSHWTDRVPRDHSAANNEPAAFLLVERWHVTVNAITDWASKCVMTLSFVYLPVKLFKNKVSSHFYFDVISEGNQIGLLCKRSQYYLVEQFDRKINKR